MRIKAINLLCVIAVIVTLLCSCNDSKETIVSTTDTAVDSQPVAETQSTDVRLSLADEQQIQNDLIKAEENYFYIDDQSTCLDVVSVEILRRKSDADYDEVHVTANYGNTYYKATADYILYYTYYDVGGWCLDDYELVEYQCVAIANPVSNSDIIAFLQNHFTTCEIINRSQNADQDGVFTDTVNFTATLEFPYLTANFSGWYTMEFYDECWYETCDFGIDTYDWSALEGTFRYKNQSFNMGAGLFSADVKMFFSNIHQINDKELSVTYSGSVYLYDKTGGYIENDEKIPQKTREFRIHTEAVEILGKEFEIPWEIRYISVPWYGTFAIFLNREKGVEATDNTDYGKTFAHFDRVVSDDELQDAFDKLHKLNP